MKTKPQILGGKLVQQILGGKTKTKPNRATNPKSVNRGSQWRRENLRRSHLRRNNKVGDMGLRHPLVRRQTNEKEKQKPKLGRNRQRRKSLLSLRQSPNVQVFRHFICLVWLLIFGDHYILFNLCIIVLLWFLMFTVISCPLTI